MKKRIVLLLLALAMLAILSVPALAVKDPVEIAVSEEALTVTLSDDLQQAQADGETYVRFNDKRLSGYYKWGDYEVLLTEDQKQTIESAEVQAHNYTKALSVTLFYKDGAKLSVSYIREDILEAYQGLLTTDDCVVHFHYPEENTVKLPLGVARGEEEILFRDDLYNGSRFDVSALGESGLEVDRGSLLIKGEEYYYADYDELGTTDLYSQERFKVWHITDEALCAELDKAMEAYYGSDLGWLEDQEFSEQVSKVFLIILFMVIPGAALILFFVLAIRAKTPVYKKLFWNLCAWSALVLIVAVTVVLVVQLN